MIHRRRLIFLLAEGKKICLWTQSLTHEKEKIYTAHTETSVCYLQVCTRAIPPTTWAHATITIINREHVEAARQAARGGGGILVASLLSSGPGGVSHGVMQGGPLLALDGKFSPSRKARPGRPRVGAEIVG